MMLYDIYYRNKALDINVPLPKARPDMECAVNTNWDGHVKVPVLIGDVWVWMPANRSGGETVNYSTEWDLATIPPDAWKREAGRRANASRRSRSGGRNGGRPSIPTPCPTCGAIEPSRSAARTHCSKETSK